VSAGSGRPAASPPLIGANYTHYANVDCSLDNTGIVTHYQDPGIRRLVRAQLAAMHQAGIETLRLLLWHMTDATGQNWGIVSSGGGVLADPYRSNLIRYLSDVRAAGFQQLTLVFGPEWTNWPLGGNYDPATFHENWQFISNVVPLVRQYGPASTHIDLSNEVIGGQFDSPAVVAATCGLPDGYRTPASSGTASALAIAARTDRSADTAIMSRLSSAACSEARSCSIRSTRLSIRARHAGRGAINVPARRMQRGYCQIRSPLACQATIGAGWCLVVRG